MLWWFAAVFEVVVCWVHPEARTFQGTYALHLPTTHCLGTAKMQETLHLSRCRSALDVAQHPMLARAFPPQTLGVTRLMQMRGYDRACGRLDIDTRPCAGFGFHSLIVGRAKRDLGLQTRKLKREEIYAAAEGMRSWMRVSGRCWKLNLF